MPLQYPKLQTKTVSLNLATLLFTDPPRQTSELVLREPTGKDIAECGYPLRFSDDGDKWDEKAMTKLIARCGDLAPPSIDHMCIADWTACAVVISSFLGRAPQISSTTILTPPISGKDQSTST